MSIAQRKFPFHVMTKPIGPMCNLRCEYCFYLEKKGMFSSGHNFRMDDATLETYVRQYIESQPGDEVDFTWQGGEPTLLGVSFFEKAVALQQKYANGKRIANSMQTNGTLLNDEWATFLRKHDFLMGISIDGPPNFHDTYRAKRCGGPSSDQVLRGIEVLQQHGVRFNTLTVVNRQNAKWPLVVYRYLKKIGSQYLQFIPVVERIDEASDNLAGPPDLEADPECAAAKVTPWSVNPVDFGNFISTIFKEWVKKDVGRIFVRDFDVTLGAWAKAPPSLCVFAPECGRGVAMESNGDVFSCDHYVYPEYRLGNIKQQHIANIVDSPQQKQFGRDKSTTLPSYCRECPHLFACNGGCPKHRFMSTPDGEPGLNYLCAGYKRFFKTSAPAMKKMKSLLDAGRAPAEIMR